MFLPTALIGCKLAARERPSFARKWKNDDMLLNDYTKRYQTWFPLGGSLIISTPLLATIDFLANLRLGWDLQWCQTTWSQQKQIERLWLCILPCGEWMAPLFGIWCFGMWRKRNGEVLGPQLHVDLAQDSKQMPWNGRFVADSKWSHPTPESDPTKSPVHNLEIPTVEPL